MLIVLKQTKSLPTAATQCLRFESTTSQEKARKYPGILQKQDYVVSHDEDCKLIKLCSTQ